MSVIERARQILAEHESDVVKELQIQLFEPVNHQLAARIRALKLDELRPIDALQLLSEIQKELN
jgi:DNA mismatch repair protein MutS